jgi:hypothetical protein
MTTRDIRKESIEEASRVLREAGCVTVSIIASWADSDTRTILMLPKATPGKRGLGKGIAEIRREIGTDRKVRLLGK